MKKLAEIRRVLPRAGVGLALVGAAAASAGIATAIGANDGSGDPATHGEHRGGSSGPRVELATGRAEEFGRWRLLRSKGAEGECLSIQMLDQAPAGAPGPIYNGCGGSDIDVGTLTGKQYTLVFGRLPKRVDRVKLSSDDAATQDIKLTGSDDAPDKYFVLNLAGKPRNLKAEGVDSSGRSVISQEVPTPREE